MIKIQDLTEYDNSELYMIIQRTYALNEMFCNSTSLENLKRRIDTIFKYRPAQWEYVEAIFEEQLNDYLNQ